MQFGSMHYKLRKYLIETARQKDKFAYYSDIVIDCGITYQPEIGTRKETAHNITRRSLGVREQPWTATHQRDGYI